MAAVSFGTSAGTWIAGGAARRVANISDHALHLLGDEHILTVGDPSIGRGPSHVLVAEADWAGIRDFSLLGDVWRVSGGALAGPKHRIAMPPAAVWHQPPWPTAGPTAAVLTAAHGLRVLLTKSEAPLVRAALGRDPIEDIVARAAARPLRDLRAWLGRPHGEPPLGLVGLGPGLTPSGDDLLAGVLLTLDAFADVARRKRLAAAVRAVAPELTSPLSATLLREAAEGRAGEAHVDAVARLVAGDGPGLVTSAGIVAGHGATSGDDFLAGLWLTATALTDAAS